MLRWSHRHHRRKIEEREGTKANSRIFFGKQKSISSFDGEGGGEGDRRVFDVLQICFRFARRETIANCFFPSPLFFSSIRTCCWLARRAEGARERNNNFFSSLPPYSREETEVGGNSIFFSYFFRYYRRPPFDRRPVAGEGGREGEGAKVKNGRG